MNTLANPARPQLARAYQAVRKHAERFARRLPDGICGWIDGTPERNFTVDVRRRGVLASFRYGISEEKAQIVSAFAYAVLFSPVPCRCSYEAGDDCGGNILVLELVFPPHPCLTGVTAAVDGEKP